MVCGLWQCEALRASQKEKLAGLWLAGEVVNHFRIYGSKVAEGFSAFRRRSCLFMLHEQADYYLNIMHMLCLHTNFNSLWPSYAIWRHRTGATLVQMMAPGHHPNQHWLIISKDQWKSPGGNFHKKYLNHQSLKMTLKMTNPKFHSTLPGANESIINACTTFICLYLRWKKKSMVFNYNLIYSLKLSYITSWSFQWWSNSFW